MTPIQRCEQGTFRHLCLDKAHGSCEGPIRRHERQCMQTTPRSNTNLQAWSWCWCRAACCSRAPPRTRLRCMMQMFHSPHAANMLGCWSRHMACKEGSRRMKWRDDIAAQDWFFKLGNTKPEGGFGVGKAPFW